ncbi:Npun_F0296 family exosortase-dependent surface protein [Sphingomonas sp. Leaf21]|uniref:Npun_F0296 family exosortase-dependent surface protein n=1 Tax=Sphingomonas sp. Leaf21 TaxID=2876550 RepID=UPI001E59077F|nr:PEP-CTERM sorting domain-containing protein [Sphingomonas sp. Leaf21]
MAGFMKAMAAAGALAGALVATAAGADSLTSVAGDQTPRAGSVTVDFNGTNGNTTLPNGFSLSGGQLVTGSANGWSQPLGDNTQYLMVNGGQQATLKSTGQGFDGVSLYWGSADSYNTLSVLDTMGNVIRSITGLDFAAPGANAPGSNFADPKYNQYVTYTLDSLTGQKIGGLKFASGQTAFELDNVSFFNTAPTSVPEPATLTLFGAGIGGLLAASRRRRKKTA